MINDLVFPEKLYVGVRGRIPFSTTDFPLAFATAYGTTKADLTRQETVMNWVGGRYTKLPRMEDGKPVKDAKGYQVYDEVDLGEYNPPVIDNVPQVGFTFDKAVSRWSTSNKWFRIQDPRGFTLEISANNLAEILLTGNVIKGEIIGQYVWGRYDNWWLTSIEHEDYKKNLLPKVKLNLEVGDELESPNAHGIYYGKVYVTKWDFKDETKYSSDYYWNKVGSPSHRIHNFTFSVKKSSKPVLLFKETKRNYGKPEFFLMSDLPKKWEIKSSNNVLDEIPFDKPFLSGYRIQNCHVLVIHKTKDDMNKMNFSVDEGKVVYENWANEHRKEKYVENLKRYGEGYGTNKPTHWDFTKDEYA